MTPLVHSQHGPGEGFIRSAALSNTLAAEATDSDPVTQPNFDDLSSLFTSAGANPTAGDTVTQAVGTEFFGGKSFENWLADGEIAFADIATTGDVTAAVQQGVDIRVTAENGVGYAYSEHTTVVGEQYIVRGFVNNVTGTAFRGIRKADSPTSVGNLVEIQGGDGDAATGENAVSFTATATTTYIIYQVNASTAQTADFRAFIKPLRSLWTGTATSLDDFDQTTAALTDNGGRGEESVDNHDYSGGTASWLLHSSSGTGTITESEGVLTLACTGGTFVTAYQQITGLEVGAEYEFIVPIVDQSTDGGFRGARLEWDLVPTPDEVNIKAENVAFANDTYSIKVRALSSNLSICLQVNNSGNFISASSFSVRKVLTAFDERGPELVDNALWSVFGDAVNEGGGVLDLGASVTGVPASLPTLTATAGATYEITYTIDSIVTVGGGVSPRFGNTLLTTRLAIGTYTETIVATNTDRLEVLKRGAADFDGVVSGISVKRVPYPNLVTNGAFDADSDWTKGTGWSIGSGVATKAAGTAAGLDQGSIITEFKWYRVAFYATVSAGTFTPQFRGGATVSGDAVNSTGWSVQYIFADSGSTDLRFLANSAAAGSIDNVIVQEVPASIARLNILRTDGSTDKMEWEFPARRNLIRYTDDFSGAWVAAGFASTDSDGFLVASGTGNNDFLQDYDETTNGQTRTFSVEVRVISGSATWQCIIEERSGAGAFLDSTTQDISPTSEWVRYSVTRTGDEATGGRWRVNFRRAGGAGAADGDQVQIRNPQFEAGSSPTAYQRIGADYMDDMTVVMAIKTSDTQGILLNSDDGVNNFWGAFHDGSGDSNLAKENNSNVALNIIVDGDAFSGTRDALHAAVADGDFHVVAMTGMDFSDTDISKIQIGFYIAADPFNTNADYAFLSIFPTNSDTLALAEELAAQKIRKADTAFTLS